MKLKKIGTLFLCGLLFSCDRDTIRVSDEITTVTYAFSDYTTLEVSNSFNAFVSFSDTEEEVQVEANENILGRIIVVKEGSTLVVRLKRNTNLKGNVTLNVYIKTKELSNFRASGASNITLENQMISQTANIKLRGSSNFEGEVNLDRLELDARGSSSIDMFGSVDQCNVSLSGSSDLRDYDLEVGQLDIELTGASGAFLSVTETIDIDAAGASTLNYRGNARIVRERLSGASEIRRR
ncbi:MAG: head GIN domain-containing protein [Saonia sp.]